MTAEEALRRYNRTWDRVKRFNDIKHVKNPKCRNLWQRAHDAWLKYLEAVK